MAAYTPILKIDVQHDYFASKESGLSFEANENTLSAIKNHRLRVKYRPTGLDIYAPILQNQLLLPLEEKLTFQWLLKPESRLFYSYTALPPKDRKGQYHISNQPNTVRNPADFDTYGGLLMGNPGTAVAGSLGSLSQLYSFQFPVKNGESNQRIPLNQAPVQSASIEEFSFINAVEGNAFDPDSQTWVLGQDHVLQLQGTPTTSTAIKTTYPIAAKAGNNLFAVLHIQLGKKISTQADAKLVYTLSLKAKESLWQYLCITQKEKDLHLANDDSWRLKVSDTQEINLTVLELTQNVNPDKDHSLANFVWNDLKSKLDLSKEKVYFFSSLLPIAFQSSTKYDLSIQRKKGSNSFEDAIIELSQPSVEEQGLKIIHHPKHSP